MKIYASRVDLNDEIKIGYELIDELRSIIPQIPSKVTYRRGHTWSDCWYVDFNLGVNLSLEYNYDNAKLRELQAECDQICKSSKYYNDFVQCSIHVVGYQETRGCAFVSVFALTKPVK